MGEASTTKGERMGAPGPGERAFPEIPLHQLIGIPLDTTACYSDDGNSWRLEIELTDALRGAALPVHGGVLSTLIDYACGSVAAGGGTELYDRGAVPVTTDLHIRYYRQPRRGPLVVNAHARRRGRRLISVDCSIADGEGRELTSATATYMVIEGALDPL
jgi:uncharacterized protein (TIGR00369 family)